MKNTKVLVGVATALLSLSALVASAEPPKTETMQAEKSESKATEQGEHAAMASSDAAMKKEARISMKSARSIAIKAAPGKVQSGELEREHGNLIYSFDIRNAKGSISEVNVNAITGKIVDVQIENKAKEAAEKVQEMAEKK